MLLRQTTPPEAIENRARVAKNLQTHPLLGAVPVRFWTLRARFALRGKGTFGQGHLGHKTAHLEVMPRPGAIFCGVLSKIAVPPRANTPSWTGINSFFLSELREIYEYRYKYEFSRFASDFYTAC